MRLRLLLVATLVAACGGGGRLPPPPAGIDAVAVAPVENDTGSALAIAGDSYLARWIGRERRTVPDVVADELRAALRARGIPDGDAAAPRLRVVLRRFEPDLPHLAYVTVALRATLADADGTVRWRGERAAWIVPTAGAPSLEAAYDTAARAVARGLVAGWTR